MSRILVACHKGTSLVSRLIAWQTRGPYSHVSLVLPDGRQIEAWSDGVHINETFDPHGSVVDFFTVAASDDEVTRMVAFAQKEVGAKYDWYGDFCFITRMHPPASDARWFCSELAYATLAAGGINLLRATEAFEVSPSLLARSPVLQAVPSPFLSRV